MEVTLRDGESVSALLDEPAGEARAVLSLGHGAGAGKDHPLMTGVAGRLADRGVAVLRYNFPYMDGAGWPPDPEERAVAVVAAAAERAAQLVPGAPLFAGGRSWGGRMTTHAAARGMLETCTGIVLLAFPLHRPKRPGTARAEHLGGVPHPLLFVRGTRDRMADGALLRGVVEGLGARATLHEVEAADHGFAVTKRSGRTDAGALDEVADAVAGWMTDVATAATRR